MKFRQVHLDFHTSEAIKDIGSQFTKSKFQEALKVGFVDSVTVFAKCHHGWSYHPSRKNEMHPNLAFDLLGAMIDAAHEIGVQTPVYLSAGVDEKEARRHPEWLIRDNEDRTTWTRGFMSPGYHLFCMNTPYLDMLLAQIEEVVSRYEVDGLFLDIVGVRACYCHNCILSIRKQGGDPRDMEAMKRLWEETYSNYTAKVKEAVWKHKPGLPIFHNGGHIRRGRRDQARMNTHLELESLPTGSWGYDHFPLSARYAQQLNMEFLGMTGKFHTWWGEFGGFKHPNALLYETSMCLANGAKCSIGDQLHPSGLMDVATYELIGKSYNELARKQIWCDGVVNAADVALLSLEAVGAHDSGEGQAGTTSRSDAGAARILMEGQWLFDVIDKESVLEPYKVIVLPDAVRLDGSLRIKLLDYVARGGKVLATGTSALLVEDEQFGLELGARYEGKCPYQPSYFNPSFPLSNWHSSSSFVLYSEGYQVSVKSGQVWGDREHPYFNRDAFAFCSHQHTPSTMTAACPGMTEGKHGIYIGWHVFDEYAAKGSLIVKEMVHFALDRLVPNRTLRVDLPAQARTTLQYQPAEERYIHHVLYASPVKKGEVEVIEDIVPLYRVSAEVAIKRRARSVHLAPEMEPLDFEQQGEIVRYTIPKVICHQMVVIEC